MDYVVSASNKHSSIWYIALSVYSILEPRMVNADHGFRVCIPNIYFTLGSCIVLLYSTVALWQYNIAVLTSDREDSQKKKWDKKSIQNTKVSTISIWKRKLNQLTGCSLLRMAHPTCLYLLLLAFLFARVLLLELCRLWWGWLRRIEDFIVITT